MALGRKTGGRQKGSRNQRSKQQVALVAAMPDDINPLDYFLKVLRDPGAPPALRFEAAKAAAPYCHSKLASIEHSSKDGGPLAPAIYVTFTTDDGEPIGADGPAEAGSAVQASS